MGIRVRELWVCMYERWCCVFSWIRREERREKKKVVCKLKQKFDNI